MGEPILFCKGGGCTAKLVYYLEACESGSNPLL